MAPRNIRPLHTADSRISRRRLIAAGGATLGVMAAPGLTGLGPSRASAQSNQVIMNVGGGSWEEAQDIAYFKPFTEETGIEVVKVPAPEIAQIRAMIKSGNVTYDLDSGISAPIVQVLAEEVLLEPIDYSVFDKETLDNLVPAGKQEFGVASLFYSVVLGYNQDSFPEGPKDWADFWDTETFPGPRTLYPGMGGGTWEIALMADGVDPKDLYPIDFDRAFASLDKIRDDIVTWWDTGGVPAQLLTDGQVEMASAWNGRIQALIDQGLKVGLNWNQGILQWDLMHVPKGAPNPANAMKLLAFMSRADRQAVFAEHIAYAPANSKAYEFISPERAAILPTSPELIKLQFPQNYEYWNSVDKDSGKKMIDFAADRWNEWVIG